MVLTHHKGSWGRVFTDGLNMSLQGASHVPLTESGSKKRKGFASIFQCDRQGSIWMLLWGLTGGSAVKGMQRTPV